MSENDPFQQLKRDLLEANGELMTGMPLWRALGFKGERAFQRAAQRGWLPIAVFELPHRRGRYAKTRDVSEWLASLGMVDGCRSNAAEEGSSA